QAIASNLPPPPPPSAPTPPPIAIPPPAVTPAGGDGTREDVVARLHAKEAETAIPAPPPRAAPIHEDIVVPQQTQSWPAPQEAAQAPAEVPSPIHTYTGDFSDKIKLDNASTATVLAAEQDA